MVNTASPRQIEFIKTLQAERVWFDFDPMTTSIVESARMRDQNVAGWDAGTTVARARVQWNRAQFDGTAATSVIETLLKCDRKPETTVPALVASVGPKVDDGRYALETDGQISFYKVGHYDDSGRAHISLLASDTEHRVGMVKAHDLLTRIAADPKAASTLYGQQIGECGVCSRTLTDETSRAFGVGPVCRARKGW